MKRLTTSAAAIAFVGLIASACTTDIPSATVPTDPALAKGGPSAQLYSTLDIGALLPGTSSEARGVNDAGDVVGLYRSPTDIYPFALVAGDAVTLSGGPGIAWGISNGNPAYVAGSANGLPARWSLADRSQPTLLPLEAGETNGQAKGVNEVGDAVGSVGVNAVMWPAVGTRISIAPSAGFVSAEGRGINDAGLAVFQFLTATSEIGGPDRGALRLATGSMIEMAPLGADVATYVNDVSEEVAGLVYVAGSTSSSAQVTRAVRWTVNATTGAIDATNVLATTGSHALGVSNAGGIAGFSLGRSLIGEAFLWRAPNVLKLGLPKGSRDARAWALSQSGQYVAGQARIGGGAMRWTITTP